jgi:hypothetical protein
MVYQVSIRQIGGILPLMEQPVSERAIISSGFLEDVVRYSFSMASVMIL